MARFLTPMEDFDKTFAIICKTQEDVKRFEDNGGILKYNKFLQYMERFNDSYGYTISVSVSNHLFGKGKTYIYTVHIYDIKK